MKALELVWPRPHLEATCMVPLSSRSSAMYSAEQVPVFQLPGRLEHLGVADATRRALAARLVDEELEEVLGHGQHVALRAEHHDRAARGDVLEGHLAGELRARHADARRAADLHGLGVVAADFLEQVGDGDPEGELVDARLGAVAADAEQLEAGGAVGAEALEPVHALGEDAGRRGQCLDVVDDGGRVAVAGDHRERRAVARLAAEALERLDEGRLLAADVGAGAEGDDDVEVEALDAADVLAQQAGGAALLDHRVERRAQVRVLAAQVDDALAGADGAAGDRHAGEHEVGELGEDDAVLERARLTLVGVADDVLPVAFLRAGEVPFHAGGEAGPAATLHAGVGDRVDDVGARHGEGRLEAGVAVDGGEGEGVALRLDAHTRYPSLRSAAWPL